MLPTVHGEFRAGADPELRFTPGGMAITKVRSVASSRKKDDSGEWKDDKTVWVNVVCFNKMAENVAESISKGDLFVVDGRLQVDEWEDKEGGKRTSVEVVANSIGPSLAWSTAKMQKTERSTSSGGSSNPAGGDPWAAPAQGEEPPF